MFTALSLKNNLGDKRFWNVHFAAKYAYIAELKKNFVCVIVGLQAHFSRGSVLFLFLCVKLLELLAVLDSCLRAYRSC